MAEPPPHATHSMLRYLESTSGEGTPSGVGGGEEGPPRFPVVVTPEVDGYDYEFVSEPEERYKCAICLLVMREPCQTPCGHLYCRGCIVRWIRGSHSRCPVDNEDISEKSLFQDNFAKREIENFQVFCPNNKQGCDVIASVKHLPAHLKQCPLALVPCPNKCSNVLRRRDLDDHLQTTCDLRHRTCDDCGSDYTAKHYQDHRNVCPGVRIQCQYCREEVTRQELQNHRDRVCPETVIRCTFYQLGCNQQMPRKDLQGHLKDSLAGHLNLLCYGVMVLFRHLNLHPPLLTSELAPGRAPETEMTQAEAMEAMAAVLPSLGASVSLSSGSGAWEHQHQGGGGGGGGGRGGGAATSGYFTPPTSIHTPSPSFPHPRSPCPPPSSSSSSSSLPCIPHSPLSLPPPHQRPPPPQPPPLPLIPSPPQQPLPPPRRGNSGAEEGQEASLRMSYCSDPPKPDRSDLDPGGEFSTSSSSLSGGGGKSWGSGGSGGSSWVGEQKLVLHTQKLVELQGRLDAVESGFKSKMRQWEQKLEGRMCHGVFHWKIHNYSRYQQEAERGETTALHSQPFLTRPTGGYKLCVRANLNGVDTARGSHLSLFIHFLQGEDDDVVQWPFTGRIVLTVLDQNDSCRHRQHVEETLLAQPHLAAFQRPTTPRNHKGFGYMEFVPLSVLNNSTYVKNDTLIIKAHVLPDS